MKFTYFDAEIDAFAAFLAFLASATAFLAAIVAFLAAAAAFLASFTAFAFAAAFLAGDADPIVGAVACLSHIRKKPIKTFIVRKAVKEHGMKRRIEGPALKRGEKVILVDDVATTGKALIEAKEALDDLGIKIDRAIVIVDRNEAHERIASLFKTKANRPLSN